MHLGQNLLGESFGHLEDVHSGTSSLRALGLGMGHGAANQRERSTSIPCVVVHGVVNHGNLDHLRRFRWEKNEHALFVFRKSQKPDLHEEIELSCR